MRKKPINLYPIADLDQANEILRKIADLQRTQTSLTLEAEGKIDSIRQALEIKLASSKKEIEKYELSLSAFANTQKQELFAGNKTVELNTGFIGFRQSTSISITKFTIKILAQLKQFKAIRIKKTVDKDVLAKYSDKALAEVKAKRIVKDEFWYEIKKEFKDE
jgi:phage host-nuclease inhibitor protein Gam